VQEEKSVSKNVIGAIIALVIAIMAGGGFAWLGMKNNSPISSTKPSDRSPANPSQPADISPPTEDEKVNGFGVDEPTGGKIKGSQEERKTHHSNSERSNSERSNPERSNSEPSNTLVHKSLKNLLASSNKAVKKGTFGKEVASIPVRTKLISTTVKSDGIHVDLSKEFIEGGGSTSMLGRLSQILYTATERNNKAKVWITIEGKKLETLGGEGIEVKQPITRKSFQQEFKDIIGEQ
jgi:spore germination protein GerM